MIPLQVLQAQKTPALPRVSLCTFKPYSLNISEITATLTYIVLGSVVSVVFRHSVQSCVQGPRNDFGIGAAD